MKRRLNDMLFNEYVENYKVRNTPGLKQSDSVIKLLYKTKK